MPGGGDAVAAFGLDVLVPGDGEPVADATARLELAGVDPVVDHAGAAAESAGRVRDADLAGGLGGWGGDVVGVSDPLHGLDVEPPPGTRCQAGGVEHFGEFGGRCGRTEPGDHLHGW
jgi:hypothetical protein